MSVKKIIALVFLILCLSVTAFGQELEGAIFISNQNESYDPVDIVKEYVIGETAYCTIFARGGAKDPNGNVDLSVDLQFIDSDNNILFEERNYAVFTAKTLDGNDNIVFDRSFDIHFESGDLSDIYTVIAMVNDNISEVRNVAVSTLLLFDTQESKVLIMCSVTTVEQLDDLWEEYFRSGNPGAVKRIITAINLMHHPNKDKAIVGIVAKSSLESNSEQYSDVAEIYEGSLEYLKQGTKDDSEKRKEFSGI